MRLSFSTRGWADMSWQELTETAVEMGFGGIELYNVLRQTALTDRGGALHPYSIGATVRALREQRLSLPCMDSSCDLAAGDDESLSELQSLIRLAPASAPTPPGTICRASPGSSGIWPPWRRTRT